MKKTLIAASMVLGVMFTPLPAAAGFTGDYVPGNWTTELTGDLPGGGAPVDATNNGTTLTLTGGDSGCVDFPANLEPCALKYTIIIPAGGATIVFNWTYDTADLPEFEDFGFLVDGVTTQLSDDLNGSLSGTNRTVSVAGGSTFGWYMDCNDCLFGNSIATITEFRNLPLAVPEPATLALLGLGLTGFGFTRRKRA